MGETPADHINLKSINVGEQSGANSSVSNPSLAFGDGNTGLFESSDNNLSLTSGGAEGARIETPATTAASETSLWLYDKDNDTVEQVTVGAAESGGAGFKVLRIPN